MLQVASGNVHRLTRLELQNFTHADAYPPKRANGSCRYCSTHAARRTLPLVVIGIEPVVPERDRDTQTVKVWYRRGDFRLTMSSFCIASSSELPRFLRSMMVTGFSVPSSGRAIAAHRPRVMY
jgi:hypothetical protein